MQRNWRKRLARRSCRAAARIRPTLEVLEDRCCPSTLTVTNLSDPAPPVANDGSLRGELLQNQTDGGGDTIQFAPNLNGSILLNAANGPLTNFGKNVSIINPNGDNITIDGQNAVEDLHLTGGTGTNVSISGQSPTGTGSLTFTHGQVSTPDFSAEGGAIFNSATTVLTNVAVTDSTATSTAGLAEGGGIFNEGDLTFSGVVLGNKASATSENSAKGGGIANIGTLNIIPNGSSATIISGNSATSTLGIGQGGGIYNSSSGTSTISGAIISGNTVSGGPGSDDQGGGIFNTGSGSLILHGSTVSGNSVSAPGGEADGGGIFTGANFSATNDTVWNNSVTASEVSSSGAFGGGIYAGAGTTMLVNVTVGNNTASSGSLMQGGGIFQGTDATLNLLNTLVSDPNGPSGSPDVSGTVANAQNDDFASTAGLTIGNNLGGNLLNVVPLLGPLANNGGLTPTVAELNGSSTIDTGISNAGANAVFGVNPIPPIDQRGASRPDSAGTNPDIGAFEFSPAPPSPFSPLLPLSLSSSLATTTTTTTTGTSFSITVPPPLNAAITWANALDSTQINFALKMQPLLAQPMYFDVAWVAFQSAYWSVATEQGNNELLEEEGLMAEALAAYINNPTGYTANSSATIYLASVIEVDSVLLAFNSVYQTPVGLEEGALGKALGLFLMTTQGSQTTAAEQALESNLFLL
jgi:hypothetical protein